MISPYGTGQGLILRHNEVLLILHNSLTRHNHWGKLGKLNLFVLFLIIVNLQLSQSKKRKKKFKTGRIPIEYESILVLKATESIGLHLITLLFLLKCFFLSNSIV